MRIALLPITFALFFAACSGDTDALPDSGLPPANCAALDTCPADASIDSGVADTGTSTATTCENDDDCMVEGEICVRGVCGPEVGCVDSSDCEADLRCIQDVCRDPCEMDEDCGSARFICDEMTGECIARCLGDGTCPEGFICEMNLCAPAECSGPMDCAMNEICEGADQGHGRCVEFTPCSAMMPCPDNFVCNMNGMCEELPTCVGDRGCEPDEFCQDGHCQPAMGCMAMTCPDGFDCVADRCVPGPCRSIDDCPVQGEICIGGVCQVPPPVSFITEVRIITPAGVVRPGTTYQMVAVALDQSGAVVPGVSFMWASTSSAVASINTQGLATGGGRAGVTQITASVNNGTSIITSAPVRLTNLGPLAADDLRVTVVSLSSGDPVAGAHVRLRGGILNLERTTDMNGVALFTSVSPGSYEITASSANFDWVTLVNTAARDLIVPLPPLTRGDRAGGIQGPVDLSRVHSTGALYFSLSGASFPSPLFGTESNALFGSDLFTVDVPVGGFQVQIGASSTVQVEFMGTPFTLKDTYYARARPGLRAAWSFGGRIQFNFGGGGGGNPGDFLGQALPYFQTFDHAVRPTVNVVAIPTIVDLADIDNDGDTTEIVPDYLSFPTVPLRPETEQSLRFFLRAENARLPFVADGNANAVIVLSGTILPGIGFVPLGLDGLQDMNGSGLIPSFTTRIAPPHSGLEIGEYAVMVLAIRLAQGGLPGPGSSRLVVTSALPTTVDVSDGWIDSPRNSEITRAGRAVTIGQVTGAEMYHLEVRGTQGAWHVYSGPLQASLSLPPPPPMMDDRVSSATVTVDAIDLVQGTSRDALFSVGQPGALGIDRATRGFSRGRVTWR